jgi:cobalt-precorrin-5B (C1)-methyltransferase
VGGTLKYLRAHPIPRLSIAGGFGKLSKLAAGHLDLHSKRSQVDPRFLAALAERAGADRAAVSDIAAAATAGAILNRAQEDGIALGGAVAAAARKACLKQAGGAFDVEILIYDRHGMPVGRAGFGAP